MPAGFTRSQVAALAALANLELTDTEMDLFARQLGDILEYATQVQRIDTTSVPPTAGLGLARAQGRPDEAGPSLPRDEAMANAPDASAEAGLFRVPRVIA